MRQPPGRKAISLILIALMMTGCTKTVEIPREEFQAASHEIQIKHRITLVDGTHYSVRRFAMTDSTLVIQELDRSDEHYPKVEVPFSIALENVSSISMEMERNRTAMLITGLVVIVLLAIVAIHISDDLPATL